MSQKRSFSSWIRIILTSLTGATFTTEEDQAPKVLDQDHVGPKPKTTQYRQSGKGTLFSKAPVVRVDPEDHKTEKK